MAELLKNERLDEPDRVQPYDHPSMSITEDDRSDSASKLHVDTGPVLQFPGTQNRTEQPQPVLYKLSERERSLALDAHSVSITVSAQLGNQRIQLGEQLAAITKQIAQIDQNNSSVMSTANGVFSTILMLHGFSPEDHEIRTSDWSIVPKVKQPQPQAS